MTGTAWNSVGAIYLFLFGLVFSYDASNYDVRRGGLTNMTASPRTNSISMDLFDICVSKRESDNGKQQGVLETFTFLSAM
jgi:hypothetical protein